MRHAVGTTVFNKGGREGVAVEVSQVSEIPIWLDFGQLLVDHGHAQALQGAYLEGCIGELARSAQDLSAIAKLLKTSQPSDVPGG